jgi:uncharacterized protein (DUF1800 family)
MYLTKGAPMAVETLLQQTAAALGLTQAAGTPPFEVIAANRMGYGPRPGDLDRIRGIGLSAYIDEQLNPNDADDPLYLPRLAAARLKIRYNAGTGYGGLSEAPGLTLLDQSNAQLWDRARYDKPMSYQQRIRPFEEVRVAHWYRAVYSKWQLREIMADFWHNHFNVNAFGDDAITATFPVYDRIIRSNCFGNFQTFLTDVGKSTAMLYYLDNYNNIAGGGEGGNENYARELFELHTFSTDNYFKFYDDISKIPKLTYNGTEYPAGYIDKDVYQAAVALTGWSVANGTWRRTPRDPNNGEFFYDPNWHYNGLKRVLGVDLDFGSSTANYMKDGLKVFELLARHPNVAKNVCMKLARRLISDTPPESVVLAARDVWMANLDAPDQLKKVIRSILTSTAFSNTWGEKIKRPFDLVVSYFRATNCELPIDVQNVGGDDSKGGYWGSFFWQFNQAGHKVFEWPTPTGFPDNIAYWANTNGMLERWNMLHDLTQDWGGKVSAPIVAETNLNATCTDIVDYWIGRLYGYAINPAVRTRLIAYLSIGGDANQPPKPTTREPDWGKAESMRERVSSMVQLLAAAPQYHIR